MKRCELCGKNSVVRDHVPVTRVVGDVSFEIGVPANVCTACGERFLGAEAMKAADEAVALELARNGPATRESFRWMRSTIGLASNELAAMLHVAPESISRWENGQREVDYGAWLVVARLVIDRTIGSTETLRWLRNLDQTHPRRRHISAETARRAPTTANIIALATGRPHYTDKNVAALLGLPITRVRKILEDLGERRIVERVATHEDGARTYESRHPLSETLTLAERAGFRVDEQLDSIGGR